MASALKFKIGADTSGLSSGLSRATRAVKSLKPVMVGVAAAGAAAFAGLTVAAAGVRNALNIGSTLSDVASQTGLTAGRVMLLQEAFRQAGLGADQVGPAVNRLQRAIVEGGQGLKTYTRAFDSLGLSISDLQGMSPEQQFDAVGSALAGMTDPAARAAAAMQIFGRSGGQLLTLFGDGGVLGSAADTLGNQASIMDRNSAVFDRTSDLLNATSTKLQGVFVGMAESIAPAILPLLERLNTIDLSGVGQQLGSAASMFINAITDGSIWAIMGNSAMIALGNAANFLWKSLSGIITGVVRYIPEIGQNAATAFSIITQPSFWSGMLQALLGAAQAFGAKFYEVIADALGLLSKIPGLAGMLEGPLEAYRSTSESLQSAADRNLTAGADTLNPFFEQVRERVNASLDAFGSGFQEGFDGVENLVDVDKYQSALDNNLNALANKSAQDLANAQANLPSPNSGVGFGSVDAQGTGVTGRATNQPLFASSLAKIGGGGAIAGAPTALLDESRRQTRLLATISERLGNLNRAPLLN